MSDTASMMTMASCRRGSHVPLRFRAPLDKSDAGRHSHRLMREIERALH